MLRNQCTVEKTRKLDPHHSCNTWHMRISDLETGWERMRRYRLPSLGYCALGVLDIANEEQAHMVAPAEELDRATEDRFI